MWVWPLGADVWARGPSSPKDKCLHGHCGYPESLVCQAAETDSGTFHSSKSIAEGFLKELQLSLSFFCTPTPSVAASGWEGTKPSLVEEGSVVYLGLDSLGEEEDGDEDEEAEAATGKRAAEDDEVGSGLRGRRLGSCTVVGRADNGTRVRLGCCMFLSGSLILNGKEHGPRFPELQSLWSCQ